MSKSHKISLIPCASKFLKGFGRVGSLITLNEKPSTSKITTPVQEEIYNIMIPALREFKVLTKDKRNMVYTFDEFATEHFKTTMGVTDVVANALTSLFNYRYKIVQKDLACKVASNGGMLPKKEFISTLITMCNTFLYTPRYFFLPFRFNHLSTSDTTMMLLLSKDISLNVDIKDPFYKNVILKDYAKKPDIVSLYVDTQIDLPLVNLGFYTKEPGFTMLKELEEKYKTGVDNLNFFWYIKSKSVGL